MARGMFWTCEYGASHDFGEKCDCEQERERERKHLEGLCIKDSKSNQYSFDLEKD